MHEPASLYGCIEQWNKHKFVAALSAPKALDLKKNYQNKHDDFYSCRAESFSWLHRSQVVNSSNAFLTSKVNIVIYYVAILRVRGHPHFYAIFCRLRRHILSKQKSAFKSNHALVYGNMFVGRITSLWPCTIGHSRSSRVLEFTSSQRNVKVGKFLESYFLSLSV